MKIASNQPQTIHIYHAYIRVLSMNPLINGVYSTLYLHTPKSSAASTQTKSMPSITGVATYMYSSTFDGLSICMPLYYVYVITVHGISTNKQTYMAY